MGYEVLVVSDGQACFDRFRQDHKSFDVIPMDFQVSNLYLNLLFWLSAVEATEIRLRQCCVKRHCKRVDDNPQMPLIDGPTSTKLIRDFEMTASPLLSSRALSHGRIPIFAVSASLEEDRRSGYARGGFDGWILKPHNFRHLDTIVSGTWDDVRKLAYGQTGSCLWSIL
jgi:CheY-like chemotaxis protein